MEATIENNGSDLKVSTSIPFEWEHPPYDFILNSGLIHIWMIELDHANFQKDFRQYLSTDEQSRAERIVIPEKRRSFRSARIALRRILSIYTGQPASNIQFKYGPSGKPYLVRSGQISSIEFNISHSADLMIAVFAKDSPLGVDLEYFHTVNTKDWVVEQYFSKNDQVMYRNLPETQKEIAFLTAWTKKEAFDKVIGTDFASGLQIDHFEKGSSKFLPIGNYEMSQEYGFWYLRFSPQDNYTTVAAIQSIEKPKPYFLIAHQGVFDK